MPATPEPGERVPRGRGERRSFSRYLVLLLAIPLLLYPLAFVLVMSSGYEHWATSTWTPMLEYAYSARQQNADVVVFGDSSAFIGIAPKLVEKALGVRSLVLPDSVGSLPVTGALPLQTYLAHNRPPRLIVLYFSPWNMNFGQIARYEQFEGQEMLLRHGSWHAIVQFALHQPTELLVFPFRLYSTFGPKMASAVLHHVDRERETEVALGHRDYPAFAALTPACRLPKVDLDKVSTTSVQELVRRYRTPQTDVMVYVAPLPACENIGAVAGGAFQAVGALPPRTLPAQDFAADGYYAHVLADAVPASTAQLIAALRVRLRASETGPVLPRSGHTPAQPQSR